MRRPSRKRGVIASGALLLLVLGCSSNAGKTTDDGGSQAVDGGSSGTGGGSGGAATGKASTGTKQGGGATNLKSGAGGATGTATTGTAATGQVGGAAGSTGAVPKVRGPLGPGITATTIKLGINWSSDGAAVAAATSGQPNDLQGQDGRQPVKAVIAYLNSHGGVAGRTIVPVWYDWQIAGTKTEAQRQQERCATYTEDNLVFAGWPGLTMSDTEVACYAKKAVQLVYSAPTTLYFDDLSYRRYPNLWSVGVPSADRAYRATVDRLHALGYFGKGAKIGVFVINDPGSVRAIGRTLKPALARYGLKVSEYAEIQSVYDPATISQAEQQEQASVLRFKTNNVTHVLVAAGGSHWMVGSWIKHAQDQQYFPRYGLNSTTGGMTEDYTGADIRPSMKGAINVGWNPQYDVSSYSSTPRARLCNQIVAKAGFNTATQQSTQLACQYLFFIKDGLDAAPELNARGFAAGLAKLGTVPAVTTQVARFDGHRDGPAVIQTSRYVASCDCWQYYGPRLPF